jgi:flavodoxin
MNAKPRTERGRILVVYYSMSGNTARVALDLAKMIDADIESLRDRHHGVGFFGLLKAAWHALRRVPAQLGPLRHDPADYALTLIGTPVWAGQMTPAVRAYLLQCAARFTNVAFFVTSGGTPAAKVVPAMEGLAGRKAVAFEGFDARELKDANCYDQKLAMLANDAERFVLRGASAAA